MSTKAMSLLVDGAQGIYAWHSLVTRYELVNKDGEPITEIEGQPLAEAMHPDDENWGENADGLKDRLEARVKGSDGKLWRIEQIEGDIWAIHPDAEWDETQDTYTVNKP